MAALRALGVAALLLCLVGCESRLTPERAQDVLQRVQQARRTLTAQGHLTALIHTPEQMLQSEAEMHRGPGVIHLKYATGRFAGWQIIEQDSQVWRVSPDGKPSASPIGPDPGMGLPAHANLQVSSAGMTRVAGRWARRYVIVPPAESVGRLVVAVDAKTFYPLRMQRFGPHGRLVSETAYRDIQYGVAPPVRQRVPAVAQERGLRGNGSGVAKTTEQQLVKLLGGPLLKPTYLPQGLQLRGFYSRQTRRGFTAEMRYSDGLRTLVVAQLKAPRRRAERAGDGNARPAGARGGAAAGRPRDGGAAGGQQRPADRGKERGWWQRFRGEGGTGAAAGEGGAGPAGRALLRERRGDRVVLVGGDIAPEELRKVLDSVPYPPGQQPNTKF